MFTNRIVSALVVVALILVIFFTVQPAASSGASARAGRSNAQAVQGDAFILRGHRGGLNPHISLGQESVIASGMNDPIADRSYDSLESLRVSRGTPWYLIRIALPATLP